jgi:hypothetical protein
MDKRDIIITLKDKIATAKRRGQYEITVCIDGAADTLKLLESPAPGVMPKGSSMAIRAAIRKVQENHGSSGDIYDAIYNELNKPKMMYVWYCEIKKGDDWSVKMFRYSVKSDAEGNRTSAIGLTHCYRNVTDLIEVPADDKVDQN